MTTHERSAAAALLVEPDKALALGGPLWRPEDFSAEALRRLVRALMAGDDLGFVRPELLGSLAEDHITSENVCFHLRKVRDAAQRRRIAHACDKGTRALSTDADPVALAQSIMAELEASASPPLAMTPILDVLERVFERVDQGHGMPAVGTGLADLDAFLARRGLPGGIITVVGAETSGGKSALANTFLFGAAATGAPAACCAFEDSADSSVNRALADLSQVDALRILRGTVETGDHKKLVQAAGELAQRPISYLDTVPDSAEELCAVLSADIRARGTRLVVVDYIQLVRAGARSKARSAREHIDYTLSRLQRLVKAHPATALLVVSQFQRDKDRERSGRPPVLGDLKESSCIEQYAKLVLLLWRPCPVKDDHPDFGVMRQHCMLLVRKNTEGETGRIPLGWRGKTLSYRDTEHAERMDYLKAVRELRRNKR